jgi:hypothetical protein
MFEACFCQKVWCRLSASCDVSMLATAEKSSEQFVIDDFEFTKVTFKGSSLIE